METRIKKTESIIRIIHLIMRKPSIVLIKGLYFLSPLLCDKVYLKFLFPLKVGYRLDLKNPQTFNEKLQWLKLYYRDPLLSQLVDKYEYKQYIKEKVGEEYVVKNYGVWNSFEEINFEKLPNKFVLKTTHDQAGVIICKDKSTFNYENGRKFLTKHLNRNLFSLMREWPYKFVKPRIIAEEYLFDTTKSDIWDYKFYCFNGVPRYMYISMGRQGDHVPFYFFDMEFNRLELERPGHKADDKLINKPVNWNLMINLAKKLSEGRPHVRIDFYNIEGKIFVGEFTLFQGGGMMPFYPQKWDYEFGNYLKLP